MKRNIPLKLVAAGLAAGFVNGLLGAGGGIILVRSARRLLPRGYGDTRDVFATALAVMLPVSAVSVAAYGLRLGAGEFNFTPYILPAVLGGAGGAMLLARVDTRWLKLIFSLITVWSGLSMLFG